MYDDGMIKGPARQGTGGCGDGMAAYSGTDERGVPSPGFLLGGGEAGRLIRAHGWEATPLGPPAAWPAELRSLAAVILGSSQPMFVVWGPARVLLYNDPYAEILAAKHPAALGRDFLEVWREIRADLVPIVERAYAGEPVQMDDILLWMERKGFREETHFAFSYSPVRDEAGAVQGFFCACTETTQEVLTARALRAERARLRDVLEGMAEGFGLMDRDFRLLELNEEALRLDGRPRAAMLGRTHWELYPGSADSPLGALYRRAMERREAVALEHAYTFPDGRQAWLDMRAYPVPEGLAVFWRDITDRKRAEEVAAEAQERVALALDAGAIIGTWDWRVPENRFTADERFARSFGLDPAECRAGLRLEQVVESVHPEDRERLQAAIGEALARGGAYSHQYRVRHQDGRYRWLEANGRVELGPDGQPLRFPGVLLDIEARRAAEAERDRAMALLAAFAEAVPGVAYAKDREGRMLVANRGATELIGRPPSAYLGRTDLDFLEDKDEAARVMANDRRIMESGVAEQVEEVVSFPDGRRATWLSNKAPLRDREGRVIGLIGSSVDITQRVAAEVALRDAEARLRRVLDGLFAFVGVLSPEGVLLEANAAPLQAAGLAPADVLGRDFWDTHWWTHDAAVAARLRAAVAAAAGGQVVRYDVPVRLKGGALVTIDFQLAPLHEADGRLGNLIASGVVIEERVRAERGLRELNETLERRVAAAIAEREQVEEALRQSQKMEAVGQLTGGVAHDFNNLLTVVKGNIDMAQRALAAAGVAEARSRRALDNAMQGAERAAALTQRLLAFSRRQPLAPKPLDVDRLVLGMADMLNRTLGETVRLEIVTSPGLWRVEADPNQLEAAILNLAVNARDAMAASGGTLTVETANARLDDGYALKHAEVAPGQYVLVAEPDATLRSLALEALAGGGYSGEEAATAGEVLNQVRAAQGRYDAVILNAALPGKPGDALLAELRALFADLPVLVTAEAPPEGLAARIAPDRCAALLPRPFTASRLLEAVRELTRRCRSE